MKYITDDSTHAGRREPRIWGSLGWRKLANAVVCLASLLTPKLSAQQLDTALLVQVRAAARMVPGKVPQSLHYLEYGQSSLPKSAVVEGGDTTLFVGAFAVFQIHYHDGSSIMVEAGHDRDVDRQFANQPAHQFWDQRWEIVQHALLEANLIIVTHEHDDHIAGVLRAVADSVARKTVLTRAQAQSLQTGGLGSSIRLSAELARSYRIVDYDRFWPIAPGVVLIKAPGHSPGSQMIYVRLQSGGEALFIGDIAYAVAAIRDRRPKPEATSRALGEDRLKLEAQIDWLHRVEQMGVVLIPSHDDALLKALSDRKFLAYGLVRRVHD